MNTLFDQPESGWMPLLKAACGQRVRVCRLNGQPTLCHRLRELGFCEEAEVTVLNNSHAVMCQVCGAKVGLSRQLAESIHVQPSLA